MLINKNTNFEFIEFYLIILLLYSISLLMSFYRQNMQIFSEKFLEGCPWRNINLFSV